MQSNRAPATPAHRLLLGVLILAWAVSWPVMKFGVRAMPPIWFGCLRYATGASCLFLLLGVRGNLAVPDRQDWPLVLASGALQMALFSGLTGVALTLVPPGRAAALAYSTPFWVLPLAAWRLGEGVSRRQGLGVGVGLTGIACIAWPSVHAGAVSQLAAYGLLLLAAGCWAVSIVTVRGHRFAGTALALAPWQMLVAALLLLPLAAAIEGEPPVLSRTGALALAYVGIIATAFAYWAMVELGRHLEATRISTALLATPGVGILISAIALAEPIDLALASGAICLAIGIGIATTGRKVPLRAGIA